MGPASRQASSPGIKGRHQEKRFPLPLPSGRLSPVCFSGIAPLSRCSARQAELCVPLNTLFVLQGLATEPALGWRESAFFVCLTIYF